MSRSVPGQTAPPQLARGAFAELASALLADGISVRFRAGGQSMTPAIGDGDRLIVAPVQAAAVGIADVVLCQTARGLAAHRVLSIDRAQGALRLTTCGDTALETDRPVSAREVRGRVVAVERDGGRVDAMAPGGALARLAIVAALELARAVRRFRARAWLAPAVAARGAG